MGRLGPLAAIAVVTSVLMAPGVANPSLPSRITEVTVQLSGSTTLDLTVDSGIR